MANERAKSLGFEPIARADARVLILGTLPSRISLACGEYYASPQNAFWRIMKEIMGCSCDLSYEIRTSLIKQNGFAL